MKIFDRLLSRQPYKCQVCGKRFGRESALWGHMAVHKLKECSNCKAKKPHSRFYRHAKSRDGLQGWCKECMKKNVKARNLELRKPVKIEKKQAAGKLEFDETACRFKNISDDDKLVWAQKYPTIADEVDVQIERAENWLMKKNIRMKNYRAFLTNWMRKSQEYRIINLVNNSAKEKK